MNVQKNQKLAVVDGETLMDARLPKRNFCVETLLPEGISHHWSYDELHITMVDASVSTITLENAKIQVSDNGRISTYALCKLDYIELGRTLNQ